LGGRHVVHIVGGGDDDRPLLRLIDELSRWRRNRDLARTAGGNGDNGDNEQDAAETPEQAFAKGNHPPALLPYRCGGGTAINRYRTSR
jgi:hypothetical protein